MAECIAPCMIGCFCGLTGSNTLTTVINPDEMGALEWMGNFKKVLTPGIHFLLPGSSVRRISTRVSENRVKTETKTKDNVFVDITISVQVEVHQDKVYEAIYKLGDPHSQIQSWVQDVVRSHAPKTTLDELFETKEEIASEVKERLTQQMAEYGYSIPQVLVTDINPDHSVKKSMNQINANRRKRMAASEQAEAVKVITVKQAEAEAESKFLQAKGMANCRSAIVEGLKTAVCGEGHEDELSAEQVTELLLMTQYFDTLHAMSTNPSCTIFLPHNSSMDELKASMMQGFGK